MVDLYDRLNRTLLNDLAAIHDDTVGEAFDDTKIVCDQDNTHAGFRADRGANP